MTTPPPIPTTPTMEAFDAAVEAELARVSHVEYDSHEICKHFALKLRDRLGPVLRTAAANERDAWRYRELRDFDYREEYARYWNERESEKDIPAQQIASEFDSIISPTNGWESVLNAQSGDTKEG